MAAVAVTVWATFVVLVDAWRVAEAVCVTALLRVIGVHGVSRVGDQMVVERANGSMFLANIGPLCSSFGVVALLGAIAAFGVSGARRRRAAAFIRGAAIVAGCNLLRIAATVLTGLWRGPLAMDMFHDGVATGFAVVFVVGGFAVFAFSLPSVNALPTTRQPLWRRHDPR